MAKKNKNQPSARGQTGGKKGKQTSSEKTQQVYKPAPMSRRTFVTFIIIMVVMVGVFVWKWLEVIRDGYFDAFVERGENTQDAVDGMLGLTLTEDEAAALLICQQSWDDFTSARLQDQVDITATDGVTLHGYYFDQGSDLTVVVIHQFDGTGTDDFLAGAQLYESYGCNFLLIDQRAHGESGGDYFGYGYLEQYDLACWLDWAGQQWSGTEFLLWGEGTGANTILFAAANGLLPDSVTCIVAESPYASLHQLATRNIWKFYSVPAVPFLTAIEYKLAHSDAGYTVEDVELATALEGADFDIPVIFLESAEDNYIINEWTEEVFEACSAPKQLISGGGTHGTVYAYCAEEVLEAIAQLVG